MLCRCDAGVRCFASLRRCHDFCRRYFMPLTLMRHAFACCRHAATARCFSAASCLRYAIYILFSIDTPLTCRCRLITAFYAIFDAAAMAAAIIAPMARRRHAFLLSDDFAMLRRDAAADMLTPRYAFFAIRYAAILLLPPSPPPPPLMLMFFACSMLLLAAMPLSPAISPAIRLSSTAVTIIRHRHERMTCITRLMRRTCCHAAAMIRLMRA